MAIKDPYAGASSFTPPSFSASPTPSPGAMRGGNGYQLSPEELDRLLAAGYSLADDGSLVSPAGQGETLPPPPEIAKEAATWDNPIFGAHMAIRNPQPAEADPFADLMKRQRDVVGGDKEKPSLSVNASPLPSPDYKQADNAQQGPGQTGPVWPGRIGRKMSRQPLPPRNGRRR